MRYQLSVKLIFMGTPEFAVPSLSKLIEDGHEIPSVFSQPDKPVGRSARLQMPPVKLLAIEHGIQVIQPLKLKSNDEVKSHFQEVSPDACIVAAYGKILPSWLLEIPRLGCINVHASLLPKYRGAAPINWAIANGEATTGVTIMQMDPGMDTGPTLSRRATEIGPQETAPELSVRLSQMGADLLSETLPLIEAGRITPQSQNDSEATYAPLLKREHGLIDWSLTARQLSNRVRAFQPWPGTYTTFRDQKLIIWKASESNEEFSNGLVGSIIEIDRLGFSIACADRSVLRIEEIQLEGKKRMAARDFVNGSRLKVGDQINQP